MKLTYNRSSIWTGAMGAALAMVVTLASAAPPVTPLPNSNAYQRDLAYWLNTYWNWYYATGADPALSIVDGYKLMPLPNDELVSGSWTTEDPALLRGTIDITLPPGTPFVLPLFSLTGERYTTEAGYPSSGLPDDPPFPDAPLLASVVPVLTIDGQALVSKDNQARFYVSTTYFDQFYPYSETSTSGAIGVIYWQGTGIVSPPLKPGVHVIHLDESWILPGYWGVIWDHTWNITVK